MAGSSVPLIKQQVRSQTSLWRTAACMRRYSHRTTLFVLAMFHPEFKVAGCKVAGCSVLTCCLCCTWLHASRLFSPCQTLLTGNSCSRGRHHWIF
jgi:hypothetical protein